METTNIKTENTITEFTFELPISKMAAGDTIIALEKSDIKCDYIGVDEKGNIVMKVSYFDWQKEKLIKIIEEMNLTDFSLNLLLTIGGVTSLVAYLKNKETTELSKFKKRPYKKYSLRNGNK